MVIEYLRYDVPPAQRDQFIAAYRSAAQELESSEHCLSYEISVGIEEPTHFVVRIEWDSVAGHERGFRSSSLFGPFFAKVQPFIGQILEMKHYQALQSGSGAGRKR
jgi:quinol monooxygenase YgiN